ncbi:MAG TPA: hypothetical protein VH478_22200 [Trebonia sp.]|jgi:hypothetical protein|nr:hypothetical protein [Trebonia sp.]
MFRKVLVAAAASGCALAAVAAGVQAPAAQAATSPTTTVTFSINAGALSITAPATASLGSGQPGDTIGPTAIGNVVVTDARATLGGSWTATVASTDWTTGGGTTAETIPASNVTYAPGTPAKTGIVTLTPTAVTLSSSKAQAVVAASVIVGNNTATWNPALTVNVPAAAVTGTYTATLTHSVA